MPKRAAQEGVALLLAVMVLAILVALIGQMVVTSTHNRSVAQAGLADLQNGYAARGGYHYATLYLQADKERDAAVDHLKEDWASPLAVPIPETSTRVWAHIHDTGRKLHLGYLVNPAGERDPEYEGRLKRLARHLGIRDEVVDRIADYLDKDTKGKYEAGARNALPYTLEELLRIPEIPRQTLFGDEEREKPGLVEFLTLWPAAAQGGSPGGSGSGGGGAGGSAPAASSAPKVNVNTAPLEVLISLDDDLSEEIARSIIRHRETRRTDGSFQIFKSPADLKNVNGVSDELFQAISSKIDVKGSVYEIYIRSTTSKLERAWLYVVDRQPDPPQLLATMLQNDFLWIREPEEEE